MSIFPNAFWPYLTSTYLDNNVAHTQETSGALEPDQSSQSLRQPLRNNNAYIFTTAQNKQNTFHKSVLVVL